MKELAKYIENLASRHEDIQHRDAECHFIDASRKKVTALDSVLFQPSVIFNRGGSFSYNNNGTSMFKGKDFELFILDHVSDTADYEQIDNAYDRCERILDEFINQMLKDKRNPQLRFLRAFDVNNIDVVYIENNDNALYGVLASFNLDITYCNINTRNPFK